MISSSSERTGTRILEFIEEKLGVNFIVFLVIELTMDSKERPVSNRRT